LTFLTGDPNYYCKKEGFLTAKTMAAESDFVSALLGLGRVGERVPSSEQTLYTAREEMERGEGTPFVEKTSR